MKHDLCGFIVGDLALIDKSCYLHYICGLAIKQWVIGEAETLALGRLFCNPLLKHQPFWKKLKSTVQEWNLNDWSFFHLKK